MLNRVKAGLRNVRIVFEVILGVEEAGLQNEPVGCCVWHECPLSPQGTAIMPLTLPRHRRRPHVAFLLGGGVRIATLEITVGVVMVMRGAHLAGLDRRGNVAVL